MAYKESVYKSYEFIGRNSDACYARVLRAIVAYKGKLYDSHLAGGFPKDSSFLGVTFLIALPMGAEKDFAEMTKTELHDHPTAAVC